MKREWQRGMIVLGLIVLSTASCVDERIVYRDRDVIGGELPASHGNFVGMSNTEAKLTVCGNCHIGYQGEWEQTAHAHAWETLEASGASREMCQACHTTNELGNVAVNEGGFTTTRDARYHQVQCESCHGPGLAHIQNPGDANIPLAPLSVGLDLTMGCGECHQGTHHPFVDEWEQSRHATVVASAADREGCMSCHTGEGALIAWGVRADYIEKDEMAEPGNHLAITCAVCHDPHDASIEGQLRFAVSVPSAEQNLCMKCHNQRGTPDLASQGRGPHAPEGPVLLGYGGWWPPNMQFPDTTSGDTARIQATHGSQVNPQLCAGCHVNRFEVTDQITGDFVFQSVGHLFEATPCLGGDGVPVGGGNCAPAERTYQTCTGAGCHGTPAIARSLQQVATDRINDLADELGRLLQQVPPTEFNANDGRYTTGEGAQFNYQLASDFGASAVHNPFLMEALLRASIRQVRDDYGLAVSSRISLERQLGMD